MKASSTSHTGHRQRLRQRLLNSKKGTLPDYEILELLLFASNPRGDVKPLAKNLIEHFGSFSKVISASSSHLMQCDGINISSVAHLRAVQEAAERLLKNDFDQCNVIKNWKSLLDYCRASIGHSTTEQFRILYLNNNNVLMHDELVDYGTVNQTTIYTREIIKKALAIDASAIILVHNHPSGNTDPSPSDIKTTRDLQQAAQAVNIILHDHVIISNTGYYSFKANNII